MRNRQLGVSLGGLMVGAFILIVAALILFKLGPPYLEFFTIKKAVAALASEKRGSPADVRKAFDQRAQVEDITSIKGSDLEVTKEGGEIVINAVYRKEIPLFGNIGVYISFAASSKDR